MSCLTNMPETIKYNVPVGDINSVTLNSIENLYIKQGSENSLIVETNKDFRK